MDFSDEEEGEIVPQCVSTYHLIDQNNNPISFAELPIKWKEDDEAVGGNLGIKVYLRGTTDDGLQSVHKQVVAWKFELSYPQPEIWVLSKNKNWIQLQNPRKSFRFIIRTILITVHWLHFALKNQKASGNAIKEYLRTSFGSYEVEPSESDLFDHISLITEAAKRDKDLSKSKISLVLVEELNPWLILQDVQTIKKPKFIVDSDEDEGGWSEEEDSFGLCAICDDGGNVLFCEGRCLRAFHATIAPGINYSCETLGYTQAQVDAVPTFMCKNCVHQQHQCFACGILGSSDKSSCQEVFPCVSATCGNFYHPGCVAKLLHPDNESLGEQLQVEIAAGESFTCPVHKCFVCKQSEDKNVDDLIFAMCRRCPKTYHRKCLPREIAFEITANNVQRAWTGLLPNKRILIYCLAHEIVRELATPVRNHLICPGVEGKGKKQASQLLSTEEMVVTSKRSLVDAEMEKRILTLMEDCNSTIDKEEFMKRRSAPTTHRCHSKYALNKAFTNITVVKKRKPVEIYSGVEADVSTMKNKKGSSKQDLYSPKKPTLSDTGRKSLKDSSDKSKSSLRDNSSLSKPRSDGVKPKQHNIGGTKMKSIILDKPTSKRVNSSQPLVDAEMEKRILTLMEDCNSTIDKEEFMKRRSGPTTHTCHSKYALNKAFTQGYVDGCVKATKTALQMMEEGYTVEEAKTVCEPETLHQIFQWKRRLDVYLAPFLHGPRYTSFGRHFTDIEKLKEIVARLHQYVQSGDTVVDFCCGANDFSCLMRDKLEKMGKSCSFRNYDIFPPKDDFSFEQRDWMSVKPEELPNGSQLIMGLNPPFGVNASLANRFINHALTFKPKLIVLIVPKETKRLDEKAAYDYDLIWEDDELLSGKSFYLPGSVDIHDNQIEQWNVKPPPLSLWSRSDWTDRHKDIAQEHDQTFRCRK
ncbi:hypothetical protein LWI29_017894 [Acer saccharum]|uniref:Zinc finger PHD-type domain-containing protein n=1 Tax=Acer saccharum TaxID=4024 RepID=A0AA39VQW4_ACESA|nr:hypothetical protein LWI29_017894 [Acer saccharum]